MRLIGAHHRHYSLRWFGVGRSWSAPCTGTVYAPTVKACGGRSRRRPGRLFDPSTDVFKPGSLIIGALAFFFIEGLAEVFGEHPWYIRFRGFALMAAGATVLALLVMYLLRPSTIPPDPPIFGPLWQALLRRRRHPDGDAP